jgi:hypothetical protein
LRIFLFRVNEFARRIYGLALRIYGFNSVSVRFSRPRRLSAVDPMWRLTPMPVRQPPSRQTSKDEKAAVGIAAIEAEIEN